MRCGKVAPLIGRYLRGFLPREVAGSVEAHVAGCARCAALLESERRLSDLLPRVRQPRAPSGFTEKVMDAVYREALTGVREPPEPAAAARAYRRMGLGFVLSAVVVAAALLVPAAALPRGVRPDRLAAALSDRGSLAVRSALQGADEVVRGALRPSDEGSGETQGGTSR